MVLESRRAAGSILILTDGFGFKGQDETYDAGFDPDKRLMMVE